MEEHSQHKNIPRTSLQFGQGEMSSGGQVQSPGHAFSLECLRIALRVVGGVIAEDSVDNAEQGARDFTVDGGGLLTSLNAIEVHGFSPGRVLGDETADKINGTRRAGA